MVTASGKIAENGLTGGGIIIVTSIISVKTSLLYLSGPKIINMFVCISHSTPRSPGGGSLPDFVRVVWRQHLK
jgi:hypothetical protein